MADSSIQSSFLKSLGAFGGQRVTGEATVTGSFGAIKAMATSTILGNTECNISDISGLVVPQGDTVLGDFYVVHISGDAILYKN
jgi:hypothetical protein